jgi:hypothetical protein
MLKSPNGLKMEINVLARSQGLREGDLMKMLGQEVMWIVR